MQLETLDLAGIGLRAPHAQELLASKAYVGFLEAHSENFFGGGQSRKLLSQIAEKYSISLHGVGLSLGRADGLDQEHIKKLKFLIDEVKPIFVSEHLTWSAYKHTHVPDLLPIPFINEAMEIFVDHVKELQDNIGRQVLIENPSNYFAFDKLDYTEPEFLNELVDRSGCGLLLDINNIFVSAHNLDYDPVKYIDTILTDGRVKQFHLAGHQINTLESGEKIYLDTHNNPIYSEVWNLYEYALHRFNNVKTLIEWDVDIPPLEILVAEANKANILHQQVEEEINACTT